jgi:FAD:protein FMN transferase
LIAALLLAASASLTAAPARLERRVELMGTYLDLAVEATSRAAALAASERALAALEATAARLSTWVDSSELARLNRAPAGAAVPLGPALARELADARRCWQETSGAFDPTVGALVAAWGLREGGRRPRPGEIARALAATGMGHLALGPGGTARRELPGLRLEEGGFGKGAGLRAALAALAGGEGVLRASLDLGGQVALSGAGTVWRLAVADPRRRDTPAVELAIDGGSLATSGTSVHGRHLLDPRTGRPAADFGSLTVWTADPFFADCLSTGLYVLGPEKALAWAARRPGVEVLVLETRGGGLVARATPGLAGRLAPLAARVVIEGVGASTRPARAGR